ncbi:MAG: hypothetical protein JWP02_1863 [Acidimicrobiales bacterium]|nr:hypothetical protein [Acidimicrobiales bacterium]
MTDTDRNPLVTMTTYLSRPLAEVAALLTTDASAVIGGAARRGERRLVLELDVPLGQHGVVSRPVTVVLGPIESDERHFSLGLEISALDSARWFPTFEGRLEADGEGLDDTRLRMTGTYRLPLGRAGRATGPLGGDRLARSSLFAFFLSVVAGAERELRECAPLWRPPQMRSGLRDDTSPIRA